MNDNAISIRNVSKSYFVFDSPWKRLLHSFAPSSSKVNNVINAVNEVNIEIKQGEAVAIIGLNGSGKSTLLQILTGTLSPTSGKVITNGRISALLELGSGFNPEYSGRDNVILNGLILGFTKAEILEKFTAIENFAEIGNAIDRPVKTYSSGMLMRLAFAVQVLSEPEILVIDEALSVGDYFFQQKCFGFIRKLSEKGVTLLFVSHDMGAVRDICQRGIFLKEGCVVYDGDKLKAIQTYLSDQSQHQVKSNNVIKKDSDISNKRTDSKIKLVNPIWSLSKFEQDKKINLKGYIIGLELNDEFNCPVTSFPIGSKVVIKLHYKMLKNEITHVNFVLKNKNGLIVTAVSSLNLKVAPPNLLSGDEAIFKLETNILLEGAEYVFCMSLVQNDFSNTTGKILDETPWIGPIQVKWDYENKIPPFFGLCGMNNKASFLT